MYMEAPGVAYIEVIVGAAAYCGWAYMDVICGEAATIEVIVGIPLRWKLDMFSDEELVSGYYKRSWRT